MHDPRAARAAFVEALTREGASSLTPVLCPLVIEPPTRAHFEALARAWHAGMHEVLRCWAGAPVEPLPLPGDVQARVSAEAREGRALGSTRYDFIVDADGRVALIECQAGDPSGMGVEEASSAAFEALPFFPRSSVTRQSVASSLRRFVAPEPEQAGLVVFVIHREAFLEWDVARLVKVFRGEGVDAVMVDPAELRFVEGALWLGERRIALVVRDSLEDLLAPERSEASRALMEAWSAGVVRVVNPVGSIAADHKVLLRRLPTPEVLDRLSPADAALVRESVPETRVLDGEGPVERERWVLKPSDGFGGFDVTIGPAVSDEAWRAAVVSARRSARPFLLQRFVRAHTAELPVLEGDSLAVVPHHVVYSAWLHGDRFGGLFARVHRRPVVNVHQGGGLVPVYTLTGR
ncbi:MAG: hypothetical protein JNJ54_26890 [Myxococcaceae bacterium]|nr:hypothetical protein [Myxococcaceae bacterium]